MRYLTRSIVLILVLLCGVRQQSIAQCVSIGNLPDTIVACKFSTVQLNATVTSPGLLSATDTTWTPPGGLSDPNIINPIATVGTTSALYKLTIQALTPFNFFNNGNFSSGNTGFSSGYIPGPGGPWGPLSNEGTYAVTTDPSLVHTNFASFGDHTTGTGQMLVVNGSATANTSIWCQTITVQPNTTYDFSAWATSAVTSNPAILQFSINNNLLGAPFALSGVTGAWQQFNLTWFSGANTSATICITNQNTQPSGNDFVIDDIEFREYCTTSDSVYIKVVNLEPAIDTNIKLSCIADTVEFTAVDNADTADEYIWDFGDGNGSNVKNPTHVYTVQGTYNVKLITKKDGCADSLTVTLSTVHILTIDFTMSDDSLCVGETVTFNSTAGSTLPLTYFWDFGDTTTATIQSPTHTFTRPGTYTIMHVVQDEVPCTDTIYKQVHVSSTALAEAVLSDSVVCEGEAVRAHAILEDGYSTYNWDFGNGNIFTDEPSVTFAYDTSGDYSITLFIDYLQCPDVTITKAVSVHPLPPVSLGGDTTICPNSNAITLGNSHFKTEDKYSWSTGDTLAYIAVRHPGIYWLSVTTPLGCQTNDSIEIFKNCYLDIPNSFTPNGDGVNDYFLPRQLISKGLAGFKMSIFSRWGQVLFETSQTNGRGWDGRFNDKDQPMSAYVYLIEAIFENGVKEQYQGNVTLIR